MTTVHIVDLETQTAWSCRIEKHVSQVPGTLTASILNGVYGAEKRATDITLMANPPDVFKRRPNNSAGSVPNGSPGPRTDRGLPSAPLSLAEGHGRRFSVWLREFETVTTGG